MTSTSRKVASSDAVAGLFLLGLLLTWLRWWPGPVALAVLGAVELGRLSPDGATVADTVLMTGAATGALACLLGGVTTLVHGARVERAHRVIRVP